MRPVCHSPGRVFVVFDVHESNDIANIFFKVNSFTENCVDFHMRFYYVP